MDDLRLIKEYKSCKSEAYEELYQRHHRGTRKVIKRIGTYALAEADVWDIAQEVWIIIARAKTDLPLPNTDFQAWRLGSRAIYTPIAPDPARILLCLSGEATTPGRGFEFQTTGFMQCRRNAGRCWSRSYHASRWGRAGGSSTSTYQR